MALSHSPRKQLAHLATGEERSTLRKALPQPPLTRRVFFCGVVVEGSENGRELPPDVQDLVASLGDVIDLGAEESSSQPPSNNGSYADLSQAGAVPHARKRATTITSGSSSVSATGEPQLPIAPFSRKRASTLHTGLSDTINELVTTERSYVKRLRTLKSDYADPLRTFARSKETAIIPAYEAKTLFGNIDQLLPVNEAFLADLEKMLSSSGQQVIGVGDVALKHFKERKGFENYKQYYAKREEAQAIFEREVRKSTVSGFSAFIDRIKYAAAADNRNRVGLRELLMDPVQRIPRYTLLFRQMIKQMPLHDPQRAKLLEADELASKIAAAEADDSTKRAAIMYCLGSTIEDFPPALVSNSRKFVDCIDVEDVLSPAYGQDGSPATPGGGGGSALHCSLLLFDDKLVIVKRPGTGERSAKALTGLDDLNKVMQLKALQSGPKKTGMVCKGVVEVTDVVASDVGGSDFQIHLESPPIGQTDRWAGRPFRAYTAVLPSSLVGLDPSRTEAEKRRFLENLWDVQARYRTKGGQSVLLCAEDQEVENRGGKVTIARTYFNIYQRTTFLNQTQKTKVVMHIDPLGSADPISFGIRGPFVVVRVQPMAGELSRYTVTSHHTGDEGEEDILQTARVPNRIIQTIHQYGLFTFKTGNNSVPSTPSATTRTRAAIFGLDAISRNLFHARTATPKSDIFGGSVNIHRRNKTTVASRSSANVPSISTAGSSMSRFTRSRTNSITTAATSILDDDGRSVTPSLDSGSRSSRRSQSKKLMKARSKSPMSAGANSENEADVSPTRSASRASSGWYTDDNDEDLDEGPTFRGVETMDESERDLVAQLALARKNSQTQGETQFPDGSLRPMEETIYEYEDEPPRSLRTMSRAGTETREWTSITPRPSDDADDSDDGLLPQSISRPESRSAERRPLGPRSPSPLPPAPPPKSPASVPHNLPSLDDLELDDDLVNLASTSKLLSQSGASPLPRSRRQQFDTWDTAECVTTMISASSADDVSGMAETDVAPLQVRKKPFVHLGVSPYRRRPLVAGRPAASQHPKPAPRRTSLRRTSSQIRSLRSHFEQESEKILGGTDSVKAKLDATRQLVKKLRTTYEQAQASAGPVSEQGRSTSPIKSLRPVQRVVPPPMTKEARARMEEMQRLIGRRATESTPRKTLGFVQEESPSRSPEVSRDDAARSMNNIAVQLEGELSDAISAFDHFTLGLRTALTQSFEISKELVHNKSEALCQRRQHECVKHLLTGTMTEMATLYDTFNEELDKVFYEVQLPEDEAWDAITEDLRTTKILKQSLEGDNKQLQCRLAEEQAKNQAYLELLKRHGIINQDTS